MRHEIKNDKIPDDRVIEEQKIRRGGRFLRAEKVRPGGTPTKPFVRGNTWAQYDIVGTCTPLDETTRCALPLQPSWKHGILNEHRTDTDAFGTGVTYQTRLGTCTLYNMQIPFDVSSLTQQGYR